MIGSLTATDKQHAVASEGLLPKVAKWRSGPVAVVDVDDVEGPVAGTEAVIAHPSKRPSGLAALVRARVWRNETVQ